MLIGVPQYIDVEDKIAGPLTGKQLLWMIALGIILLLLWNILPKGAFFIAALPLFVLFGGLAFFRPYGQPLGSFLINGASFYLKPKIYVWKRTPERIVVAPHVVQNTVITREKKKITQENLRNLAELLDNEGQKYNKNVSEILLKNQQNGRK